MKNKGYIAIAMMVAGMMVASVSLLPLDGETKMSLTERSWGTVSAADASPGVSGGVINVFIVDNAAGVDYDSVDITEAHAAVYASFGAGASLDAALDGDVPYNTPFDIVIKCQYNYTHAYNVSSSSWDVDYVRGLITSADLSIDADTTMSKSSSFISTTGNSAGDTGIIYLYMDNGGFGYQMAHGETFNVTSFKQQAWY